MMKINAYSQAQMIKLLLDGPHTCMELAEATGLHCVTVQQYMRELRRADAAHISAWEKDSRGRDVIKVYKLGAGKDAKREKLTGAERQARIREKRKAQEMAQVMAGTARYVQAANGRLRFEAAA
jgi:predicted ArsR family transcriptional regulator